MDDENHWDTLVTRLNRKRYEIIALILDLPVDDQSLRFEGCFWNEFELVIGELTSHFEERQDWQAELERLLP